MSWKHKLKLISHPFNALWEFPLVVYKLPGKLRNWQSGSHPCFTLYINNWPKPQLRNGSPQRSWRSNRFFFENPPSTLMTWPQLKTDSPEGTVFLTCSIQLLYIATTDSSDQSIGLPSQILLKPSNRCYALKKTLGVRDLDFNTIESIDSVRVHTASHSLWP